MNDSPSNASSGGPSETAAPAVFYTHVTTDESGLTVTRRRRVDGLMMQQTIPGSPSLWATEPTADIASRSVWVMPPAWEGGWHPNPRRQFVVPLSGHWWVETQDGIRTVMGPGDLHLGDDVEALADADGRVGHASGVEGDDPVVLLMLPASSGVRSVDDRGGSGTSTSRA